MVNTAFDSVLEAELQAVKERLTAEHSRALATVTTEENKLDKPKALQLVLGEGIDGLRDKLKDVVTLLCSELHSVVNKKLEVIAELGTTAEQALEEAFAKQVEKARVAAVAEGDEVRRSEETQQKAEEERQRQAEEAARKAHEEWYRKVIHRNNFLSRSADEAKGHRHSLYSGESGVQPDPCALRRAERQQEASSSSQAPAVAEKDQEAGNAPLGSDVAAKSAEVAAASPPPRTTDRPDVEAPPDKTTQSDEPEAKATTQSDEPEAKAEASVLQETQQRQQAVMQETTAGEPAATEDHQQAPQLSTAAETATEEGKQPQGQQEVVKETAPQQEPVESRAASDLPPAPAEQQVAALPQTAKPAEEAQAPDAAGIQTKDQKAAGVAVEETATQKENQKKTEVKGAVGTVEAALELASTTKPAQPDQEPTHGRSIWIVVGGGEAGGIIVRQGKSVQTPEYKFRLKTGTKVEQMDIQGKRLHYRRLRGDGPDFGWVSIEGTGGKILMAEIYEDD